MNLQFGISLGDKKVYMRKRTYSDFECEVIDCSYPGVSLQEDVVVADITMTHKDCLKNVMRVLFPTIVGDKFQNKNELVLSISEMYSNYLTEAYSVYDNSPIFQKLMEHQKYGVIYGINRLNNLFGYQQGTGKTLLSIALNEITDSKAMVVCPAVAKYNTWFNQLKEWGISTDSVTVIDTNTPFHATGTEKYVIINYDILEKYFNVLLDKGINHMILDECHYVKNTESKRFKHIHSLSIATESKLTLLSGTPIKNRLNDMYAYLHLSNHPLGSSKRAFLKRFTVTRGQGKREYVVGGKNIDQLSVLISQFTIRKLKSECLQLPDKIHARYVFDMGEYFKEYMFALQEFARIKNTTTENVETYLHRILILTTKAKIKGITELAEVILENDEKVALFTSYKEPIHMLKEYFGERAVVIDGSVPALKRSEIIEDFKTSATKNVAILQMDAAGVSLNLQFMYNAIICNYPLTYAQLEQVMDRFHRIGQKNSVNYYHTLAKGSIDERMFDLCESKRLESERVIDGSTSTISITDFDKSIVKELINSILNQNQTALSL